MKQYAALIFALVAIALAVFTLFGDESYKNLSRLRSSISFQKEKNEVLREKVEKLRNQVNSLQNDDRALEKAARNELGMVRPNEQIFLFEGSKDNNKSK